MADRQHTELSYVELCVDSAAPLAPLLGDLSKPVVLRGACRHFPLVQCPDDPALLALLSHYHSGEPVNACYLPPESAGRVFYNKDFSGFNFQAGRLPFAELASRLQQLPPAAAIYMGSTEVRQYFPGVLTAHQLDLRGLAGADQALVSLWLGTQCRVAAHYDFPHNLACNLYGRRQFTLLPPEQIINLYPGPLEFAPGGQEVSLVDFHAPDLTRFPRFADAKMLKLTLEPGDVLFIPSMWWHHVEALSGLNLLLTHWWRDTPAYLGRPNNALLAAVLSLRSLPKAQRKAWQAIFDYYIFADEPQGGAELPLEAQALLTQPLPEPMARQLRALLLQKLNR